MSTTPTPLRLSLVLLCFSCLIGLIGLAWAEPTTVPSNPEPTAAEMARPGHDVAPTKSLGVGGAPAVDVPNPSSTIQMLLELQATPESAASASDPGRRSARPGSARPGSQPPAANPFGNGENPFGSSPGMARATPATASQPAAVEWQSGLGTGALGGSLGGGGVNARNPELFPPQSARGASRDEAGEQRWWMPMALIRWVREHRQAVLIGAAVALGLAWAATSYSQRRR